MQQIWPRQYTTHSALPTTMKMKKKRLHERHCLCNLYLLNQTSCLALVSSHMLRNVHWNRTDRDLEVSKASPSTANPLLTGVCATRPSERDNRFFLLSSPSLIAPCPPTTAMETSFFPSSLQQDFMSSPTSQTRIKQVFPSSAHGSCFSGLWSFCSSSFLKC